MPSPSVRILLAAAALAAAAALRAAGETRTFLLTEDWPPYNYLEGGTVRGFSSEVVGSILRRLGVAYRVESMQGVRARQILDKGPRVFFFTMLRTPEREARYKWIGPLGEESIYFYKRKGSPLRVETLEDARKAGSVACRTVGLVFSFLSEAGFGNLDPTPNPEGIYQKAASGRCDLAIGEPPLGIAYWLERSGLPPDSLERTPLGILRYRMYIACSLDIPDEEVARWQAALDGMKASGEYGALYRKYAPAP
ncbi:MAG TPA: transporter substrate-binding domain-containing protein [Spirochaetales bacterium]|nr:transporter substrate-binding domain-containing protein [Spirochaetales bacterium]HRY55305.1 transporter substrate-binding domain-containing protein [Spirochaetia bacterium]HRZ64339.1 transporter substrate-binding domain-containing protein [Spirochaetia bacterium]